MKKLICFLLACMLAFGACAEESETRLTDFVDALMSGEDTGALYSQLDSQIQSLMTPDAFEAVWPQLVDQCGPFVGYYGPTKVSAVGNYTVLTQLLDMTYTDLLCTMSLHDDGTVAGFYFTFDEIPTPSAVPAKVREESVYVGEEPWKLPGTLLIPESHAPVPAVVLVQGSGPTNRDEHMYAVKPFLDIANALSEKGIAVLRYDKRTFVYKRELSQGSNYRTLTVEEEVIQDAIAAGRMLAADSRIDAERIYIMGHSLGAMLAPRIVSQSEGVFSGMILAAGTNRSFLDVLLRQARTMDTLTKSQREELLRDGQAIYGMTKDESLKSMFNGLYAYYYWEMLQYPATAEYLEALALPTLIINGSRDIQVVEEEGRETWEQVLDMDAPWLTCYWTDVNHLMMRPDVDASKYATVDEYKVPCTVARDITDLMAAFILNTEESP